MERVLTVLKKVAVANGVSLEEVQREINFVIEKGMNSDDLLVRKRWEAIPKEGERPTVEELMMYLVKEVHKRGTL